MILTYLAALTATPATLPAAFKAARCGDTITLASGEYGAVNAPRLSCPASAVGVDASAARMTSLVIRGASGLNWKGGRVRGSGEGSAVTVDGSTRIRVSGMVVSGARIGMSLVRGTDMEAIGNRFDGVRSDGINITQAQRVRIIGNACVNTIPVPAVWDAAGKMLKDGDHADCIQGWSMKGTPPVADVLIVGNTAEGPMQGIWFGNTGQGGYDRITIRDNDLRLSGAWHGISVYEGRAVVIRNNRILPISGSRQPGGNRQLTYPWVYAPGSDAVACGNVVAAQASRYCTEKCR